MKNVLFACSMIASLAVAADAPNESAPQTDPSAVLDAQLADLKSRVDTYYSAREDFDKKMQTMDPQLKSVGCVGVRAALADTRKKLRNQASSLKKQRKKMSDAQLASFTDSDNRLAKGSPDIPACKGK